MNLKKENIIREETFSDDEVLTIVYEEDEDIYGVAVYHKNSNAFSKHESCEDREEAYALFLNLARKLTDRLKLDPKAKFDTFFCESAPEWGHAVGLCNVHTFDREMTLSEAEEYLENNLILNPDNQKRYTRIKFPMMWSKKLKKYLYYEAVIEEERTSLAKQSF